ncbi:MAG: hypothetical protein K0V04_09030 [Deltaproteobacteria bacterium]|nr:hypothetical protein [Deltaproteobacteria bacterium]
MDIEVGQRFVDLHARAPGREGTVLRVYPLSVCIRWNTGRTTRVSRTRLLRGRYLALPTERQVPAQRDVPAPTIPADCRAGEDSKGRRLWRCWVCGGRGRLRSPWRVLWWPHRWAGMLRGTVVCSDACHGVIAGGRHVGD